MARQFERREATRRALVAAARDCFVEQGFAATSTEAVLARAGVSKGALYHHFASKTELMAAVFADVSRELIDQAQAAAPRDGAPRKVLGAALKAWLRAVLAPMPRRIILEAGPAVLGLARAREIEEAITQAPMRRAIANAVDPAAVDSDLIARLLNAAVAELALAAVQRGLETGQLASCDAAIDALVDALVPAGALGVAVQG